MLKGFNYVSVHSISKADNCLLFVSPSLPTSTIIFNPAWAVSHISSCCYHRPNLFCHLPSHFECGLPFHRQPLDRVYNYSEWCHGTVPVTRPLLSGRIPDFKLQPTSQESGLRVYARGMSRNCAPKCLKTWTEMFETATIFKLEESVTQLWRPPLQPFFA